MRKRLFVSAIVLPLLAWGVFSLRSHRQEASALSRLDRPSKELARVKVHGLFGFIDRSGKTVIRPQYTIASEFSEGLAAVGTGSYSPFAGSANVGYIDATGATIIDAQYDFANNFSEGLAAVHNCGQAGTGCSWGFIDQTGKMVIEPQYLNVTAFSNGVAAVNQVDNDWFLIDRTGRRVSAQRRTSISQIVDGFALASDTENGPAAVTSDGALLGTYIINVAGNRVGPSGVQSALLGYTSNDGAHLVNNLFPVYIGGLWGYMDRQGRLSIPPRFKGAEPFSDGMAAVVTTNSEKTYIDQSGQVVCVKPPLPTFPPEEEGDHWLDNIGPFVHGFARITFGKSQGFINKQCLISVTPHFKTVSSFSDGLALVTSQNPDSLQLKHSFINESGAAAFVADFSFARDFQNGLAIAAEGSVGFIDTNGKWLIPPAYDMAWPFQVTASRNLPVVSD